MTTESAFYSAMREQILATPLPARTRRLREPRIGVLSGATIALAATIAAIVLALGATASTPPAYAVVKHADGSVTITLRDLAIGIPALNNRFRQLGIPETVIPMTAGCSSRDGSGPLVMHPDPLFEYGRAITVTLSPARDASHRAPPGFHYVLAAMQLPNGKLLAFIGALKRPIPSYLPYSATPSTDESR
jgi:hypothetical protein